jgi:hypothetical protein
MSGSVPRLPWRSAVLALAAVVCLLAAASALAAHPPRPTAAPLWEAYPLAGKQATQAATPPVPAQASAPVPRTNAPAPPVTPLPEPRRKVDPAIVVLFYIAIVTLIVTLALLVRRQLRRGRSPRTVRG